jgi:hypothetical protein
MSVSSNDAVKIAGLRRNFLQQKKYYSLDRIIVILPFLVKEFS